MILSCLGLKVLVPSKALEEAGNASGRPGLRGAAGSFSASRRRGRRGSNLTELGLWAEHPSWNKAYGEQKDLHHSQSIPNMWIPGCFEVYSIYSSGLKLRMTFSGLKEKTHQNQFWYILPIKHRARPCLCRKKT